MLTIRPDIKITRRLYSHFVVDEADEVLLQTPHLAECFTYVLEHSNQEVMFVFDTLTYRVKLTVHPHVPV